MNELIELLMNIIFITMKKIITNILDHLKMVD